jgi:hypothetical protein
MGDVGDYWREHKAYQRSAKERQEENCARGKHVWAKKVHGIGEECLWCDEEIAAPAEPKEPR